MGETVHHTGPLWRWKGSQGASWFFVTIDGEAGETVTATALMRRLEGMAPRNWGSVKVEVTLGHSTWRTSLFPQKDADGWLLPVKAAIRKAEGLVEGAPVTVSLTF